MTWIFKLSFIVDFLATFSKNWAKFQSNFWSHCCLFRLCLCLFVCMYVCVYVCVCLSVQQTRWPLQKLQTTCIVKCHSQPNNTTSMKDFLEDYTSKIFRRFLYVKLFPIFCLQTDKYFGKSPKNLRFGFPSKTVIKLNSPQIKKIPCNSHLILITVISFSINLPFSFAVGGNQPI